MLPLCSWARFALTATAFAAAGVASTLAQAAGAISGRVSNAATGSFLEGAVVTLQPAGLSALTTREGQFSFPDVPPGQYQLRITYTGLDPQSLAVSVEPGRAVQRDVQLTSEIYQLSKFVVAGEREGNALAITMQRHAPNVKNVLSADAFGNIADQNLGNFLLRLPGIGTEKSEGEILRVQIRGVNADLNAVTVDGTRAASGSTRGLSRGFEIDKLPADFIESIEVTKAPTPDMDADSIGGAVNLKTKSAFDRRDRAITYMGGLSYNPDRNTFRPLGSFMYSDLLGAEDRIGVLLTTSFNRSHKPRDSSNLSWERTTDVDRPAWFHLSNYGEDQLKHTRAGIGLRTDYKLSETAKVHFNAMYAYYKDGLNRRRGSIAGIDRRIVARIDPNGIPRDSRNRTATIMPGWTDTVTQTVNHSFRLTQNNRVRDVRTWNFQAGGEHKWGKTTLDYNANFSPSKGSEHRDIFSPEVRGVSFTHERIQGGKAVRLTQTGGPDIYDPANYRLPSLEFRDHANRDRIVGAQVNFRKPFETTLPTYIKTGARMRSQKRQQDQDRTINRFVGSNPARFHDPGYDYRSFGGVYPNLPFYHVPTVVGALRSTPGDFQLDVGPSLRNSIVNDGEASEDVYAAYLMGAVTLGRLNVLAGVRSEETRLEASGNVEELTPAEVARRRAWQGPLTPDEIRRRTIAEFGNPRTASASYRDFFPSVHLRYEFRPGLLARASWSTGIGRPNFGDLLPDASIDHDDREIVANNTNLRPQYSDNFDLSLEYYFEPAGLVSVGAFHKDIRDFVFTDDAGTLGPGNDFGEQYVGYALRTDFNGGSATIRGFEVAYQQQFSFLPGFWKGFGAFANYTWLESEGNYGGPGTTVTNSELENFVPRTANVGLSYIGYNWTVRAQMNYTGVHLDSFNSDASRRQYIYENYPIDLNLRYDFSPRLGVFLDVINVFNEPTNHEYTFTESRRSRNDKYTAILKLGVSGRF